jgi:hypothetical protein
MRSSWPGYLHKPTSIWVVDLGNKPTNFKNLWLGLGPYFLHVNWDFFVRELGKNAKNVCYVETNLFKTGLAEKNMCGRKIFVCLGNARSLSLFN